VNQNNTDLSVFQASIPRLFLKFFFLEATKNLNLKPKTIETPLVAFTGSEVPEIVVVPILRAGLAMLFAVQEILPTVAVGLNRTRKSEQTARAREYYRKFPKILPEDKVFRD